MPQHPLGKLLQPASIAVVGASNNPRSSGSQFTSALIEYGYKGRIFPINPKSDRILDMPAYPRVSAVPEPVDYVISAIPAAGVLDLMEDCAQKGVKLIHLFTARFGETGRKDAADLERRVLEVARQGNVRIIGPNCMGLYVPRQGIAFSDALPKAFGNVGLISQSGQMAEEITRYGAHRGVFFSKAISYGNALDLNECDFLEFLTEDEETKVILMYMEGIRDGKRFPGLLKAAAAKKPVVVLKGGRGNSGRRAAASHTASLAGSQKVLTSVLEQAGAALAGTAEELIDLAAIFLLAPPITGYGVAVAGGGGGASVLSADECEESGLSVVPLPDDIRATLKENGSAIWDWVNNPVDMSIRDSEGFTPGVMLELMDQNPAYDLLIAIMSDPHHERQRDTTPDQILEQFHLDKLGKKPLLAVVANRPLGGPDYNHWAWKIMCELRTKLLDASIPFFPSMTRAATAARKAADYYLKRGREA